MLTSLSKISFHEDDYRQVELLPENYIFLVSAQLENINNKTEDSIIDLGYTEAYSRKLPKNPLLSENIKLKDIEIILNQYALYSFNKVESGYGSQMNVKTNIVAYGFENYIIFFEYFDDLIGSSWITYSLSFNTEKSYPTRLLDFLSALADRYKIVLVDWNQEVAVKPKSYSQLQSYIDLTH